MHAESFQPSAQNRRIGIRLTPRTLSPRVLEALRALGYRLEEPDELDRRALEDHPVWLVDTDRIDEFPDPASAPDTRLLAIASPRRSRVEDPRIFAQTPRPGRLTAVYEMLQSALEDTPRRSPRVETRLSARCIRSDRRSIGAVLSLSEGGCLLRSSSGLRKGARLSLQLALPDYGLISTRAECRYVRRDDAGIAFDTPPADVRNTISHYVTAALATGAGAARADSLGSARSA